MDQATGFFIGNKGPIRCPVIDWDLIRLDLDHLPL